MNSRHKLYKGYIYHTLYTNANEKQTIQQKEIIILNQTVPYGTSVCPPLSNASPPLFVFILLAIKSRSTITAKTANDAGRLRTPTCTCSETPTPSNINRISASSPC